MPNNNRSNFYQRNNIHINLPIHRRIHTLLQKISSQNYQEPNFCFGIKRKPEIIDILIIFFIKDHHFNIPNPFETLQMKPKRQYSERILE